MLYTERKGIEDEIGMEMKYAPDGEDVDLVRYLQIIYIYVCGIAYILETDGLVGIYNIYNKKFKLNM